MQKTLENYLESADGAAAIMAHARLLMKLGRLYEEIAPSHLAMASRLANYKSRTLVIHADNGPVAAKLRQLAPTLADGFSQRGIECNGVQVKVQAAKINSQSMASTKKPLTANARGSIGSLHDALPESPLRSALNTLLERSAKAE